MGFIDPYAYQPAEPQAAVSIQNGRRFSKLAVSFPSAVSNGSSMGNVTGVCYLPQKPHKSPLVVLVHGIGDSSTIPCHALARSLVGSGIASFVIYLPIHSRRLPQDMKDRFFNLSVEEWFELYRVSVINIRQALDWAETRSDIDCSRMGIAGISFGGYVAGIALGIDHRLKSGAMLLACGNMQKLAWTRSTKRIPRWEVTEAVYREAQKSYLSYVDHVSAFGFENVTPPESNYAFDPYTFCSKIKEKPLYLTNALWDEYFPRETAKEFWQACGRPPQLWLPAGHATAWLFYPLISNRVRNLFKKAFSL
ncbi:alpha/beta hydrolase family protein [Dehalogenimonas etheniformans]|uniref:Abhydrolase domain-containing 18 n=1 Tax=Dehalogenimonas etheniformans TaxID=1536648 RepID=A0A2P5P7S4_9CHLR|nr:alpha/beta hydrolase family protein [Dehalogenimonas etheniformans]PPD58335.1 hypothetical protein JP09_004285 [Dehalogenimonas etheniformans]QNT76908.1 alpha/beta hydrolase family protein [Dehalogenimonas etheniformans]